MSTNSSNESSASAAATGKDAVWIAYILHAVGYLSVMMWPALAGLIVNYVKRGDARGGLADSHHEWLIRTFWYGLLWYLLSLGVLLWSAWPVLQSVLRIASAQGAFVIDWATIFAVVGAAALGATGLLLTWFWLIYRLIRGIVRLANSQPMP